MKVGVYLNETKANAVSGHMQALANGLIRHGVEVETFIGKPPLDADACAVWGFRKALTCMRSGFRRPILVVERGYLGDRLNKWTSLGWDGLNGRARFNKVWDSDRFNQHFLPDMKPWCRQEQGYALIMGQVLGDMSLSNVDVITWYKNMAVRLLNRGYDIKFRPHPNSYVKGHPLPRIPFTTVSEGTLDEALSGASLVCAYSSNSLVDAVMAGVPIYAEDVGSMVYDLSSRDLNPYFPEREGRLNEIANVQWTLDEISSGLAWEVIKEAM